MNYDFLAGDILFSNLDCDEGAAIQNSTKSPWTHVGLITIKEHQTYVVEAHHYVKLTNVNLWIEQCDKKIALGRVLPQYEKISALASQEALKFLGRPYNHFYEDTTEKLYCSSLIYYAFKQANNNIDFFHLK